MFGRYRKPTDNQLKVDHKPVRKLQKNRPNLTVVVQPSASKAVNSLPIRMKIIETKLKAMVIRQLMKAPCLFRRSAALPARVF